MLVWAAIAACSGSDETTSSTSNPTAATAAPAPATATATATAAPAPVPVTTPAAVAPTSPPVSALTPPDGPTLLSQAFDQLSATGYHFVTTGTAAVGQPAAVVEGDTIGGSTRMVATSQGQTAEYVVLPEGTWVFREGAWDELEQAIPASDPIGPLRGASSVAVVSHTAELTTLVATYPASSIVPTGDEVLNVTFEIAGTTIRSLSYTLPASTESSRTDFGPLAITPPITAPSA